MLQQESFLTGRWERRRRRTRIEGQEVRREPSPSAEIPREEHHPYGYCFPCLAAEHGVPEFDVREIAQVAVLREGFRVLRRICYRCDRADEMLVAPDPTCPS